MRPGLFACWPSIVLPSNDLVELPRDDGGEAGPRGPGADPVMIGQGDWPETPLA
jgi:hypothetical protein